MIRKLFSLFYYSYFFNNLLPLILPLTIIVGLATATGLAIATRLLTGMALLTITRLAITGLSKQSSKEKLHLQ